MPYWNFSTCQQNYMVEQPKQNLDSFTSTLGVRNCRIMVAILSTNVSIENVACIFTVDCKDSVNYWNVGTKMTDSTCLKTNDSKWEIL
jgi:hypothetical protein